MAVLKLSTPGVYVDEVSTFPPSVAEVETAIPAFIGYTEKADQLTAGDLKLVANKINNLSEFEHFYGGAPVETNDSIKVAVTDLGGGIYDVKLTPVETELFVYNLYYAVKHFYDNGGGTCYIISVNTYATTAAPGTITVADFTGPNKGLAVAYEIDEVTLIVVPETCKMADADYITVVKKMILNASELKDRFALIDPKRVTPKNSNDPNGDIDNDVKIIRDATASTSENRYAAAYYPFLISTYAYKYDLDSLTIDTCQKGTDVTAFSVADFTGKPMHDSGFPNDTSKCVGKGSALYAKIKDELGRIYVTLPPSGAIAGLYTRVDSNKGVWKAPANESLLSVLMPSIPISSREQENLNIDPTSGKSINVIRSFPGYGTLVWGARTLNGNDNEWKYISVRRFFNMVEESIKKSIQWAVFEPNTINTWVKVQAMIENYLFLKWREGALAGVKPEQAFFVRVGLPATMTSLDVLEGRMNVEIGMAVARPAEFIILKFSQLLQQS